MQQLRIFWSFLFWLALFGSVSGQGPLDLIRKADSIYFEDPSASLSLCEEAAKKASQQSDELLEAKALYCEARAILTLGDVESSFEKLNSAIDIFIKEKDSIAIANSYNLLGIIHGRLNQIDESIQNHNKALSIFTALKDTSGITKSLSNSAIQYREKGELNKAEELLLEALELKRKQGIKNDFFIELSLGVTHRLNKNFRPAELRLFNALQIAKDKKMRDSEVTALFEIGFLFIEKNDLAKAEVYLDSSYQKAKALGLKEEVLDVLNGKVSLLVKAGNYKAALDQYKAFIDFRDSLYGAERVERIARLEKEVLIKEKESEINLANLELEKSRSSNLEYRLKNFWLGSGLLILVLSVVYLIITLRNKQKTNRIISEQKKQVEFQKMQVEEKNNEIISSIQYAKRLQEAILPRMEEWRDKFPNSFILYKPRDIVAGDFYWMTETLQREILFGIGDCTGHGVPGAMVSVVGSNALKEASATLSAPAEILTRTSLLVESTFSKGNGHMKDGMDLAFCSYHPHKKELRFTGANRDLWLIRKGSSEVEVIKGNHQPIGNYVKKESFEETLISVNAGDRIYLFTDGYPDQFGGESAKKLKTKNFMRLIISIQRKSMVDQKKYLQEWVENWQGDLEQVDDITVCGIEF